MENKFYNHIYICKGCAKCFKDEYGSSMGFTKKVKVHIIDDMKQCDYYEMPDGRFRIERRQEKEAKNTLKEIYPRILEDLSLHKYTTEFGDILATSTLANGRMLEVAIEDAIEREPFYSVSLICAEKEESKYDNSVGVIKRWACSGLNKQELQQNLYKALLFNIQE